MGKLKRNMQGSIEILIRVIKGLIIGVGAITAGAGTFAILLGIYDRTMEIIAKPFKNFKSNLIFISPIVFGIAISFLLLKNHVAYMFNNYEIYVKCFFFGIILGGIPTLMKQANKERKRQKVFVSIGSSLFFNNYINIFNESIC